MTAKEIQALNVGDTVHYAGKLLTVADWVCHKDVVMLGNERLWAEPLFTGLLDYRPKATSGIHPAFWHQITKA